MNHLPHTLRRCGAFIGTLALTGWLGCCGSPARAQDATNSPDADKAWREVKKAIAPPMTPPDWQTNEPSQADVNKFFIPFLKKGADAARDFYVKYPSDAHAAEARKSEFDLLTIAANRFGDTSQTERLDALTKSRLSDPKLTDDEKFDLRVGEVRPLVQGLPGTLDQLTKVALKLQKDYPKREEVYQLMMMVVEQTEGDKARDMVKVIVDSPAPDQIKDAAKGMLKRLDAVGKPVTIQYTAVDGRDVDVAKLKGKVVLIDYWATWCGPCVAELPHVKAAYDKLHDQGFEIVGISFDEDKDKLTEFVAKEKMAWPQFFDGQGWKNKFGVEFGINAIPCMWLVDKKGNLRDVNAREDLADRVGKLLAE